MLALNHGWHYLRRKVGLPPENDPVLVRGAACALTFIAVTSAWVLFRASSLESAGIILSSMYGIDGQSVTGPLATYLSTQWRLVAEFRWSESSTIWLLLVGSVAFILPNTYQVFESFRPALVERPFEDAASKPRLTLEAPLDLGRWLVAHAVGGDLAHP
jgi:alginate O-acetyltransferase complex protein AlgI